MAGGTVGFYSLERTPGNHRRLPTTAAAVVLLLPRQAFEAPVLL